MVSIEEYISHIFDLIGRDELPAAIDQMQALLRGNELFSAAVMQSARYQGLKKEILAGTVTFQEATLEKNRIRFALVNILQELEDQRLEKSPVTQQVEEYLARPEVRNNLVQEGNQNIGIQDIRNSNINIQMGRPDTPAKGDQKNKDGE